MLSTRIKQLSPPDLYGKDGKTDRISQMVVYEGLLPLVSSDDEPAVVLGHEVAYAVAKHSNERMRQEIPAQYGGSVADVALSNKSATVQTIGNTVFGLGAQLGVMLPYSRKHEPEADYMGL
jgi:predicted Zn-dependent protease